MHLALATCSDLPDWEVDDRPLHEALIRRGARISQPTWDEPAVDWSRFDACLIRTTWDYMEKREAYLAWAEHVAGRTRLFNDAAIVRWNTHKSYLRDLETRGAPVVPTVWLERGTRADLSSLLAERGGDQGFLNPAIGATARQTLRFGEGLTDLATAQEHLDRMLRSEDMLVQPYLPSVETEGERSAIFIDGRITHTVRKVPVPGDYRVQDDFGAHDEPTELGPRDLDLARRIVASVNGDLLYARTDFLRDRRGQLRLTELEVVEPSLFFRHAPHAAELLADALIRKVEMGKSK
jgi:glutathione synthase/RimK-type ligase-like ATP-grasp enzyme